MVQQETDSAERQLQDARSKLQRNEMEVAALRKEEDALRTDITRKNQELQPLRTSQNELKEIEEKFHKSSADLEAFKATYTAKVTEFKDSLKVM